MDIINQIYNKNVYNWAKSYSRKTKYFPLRHGYGLFAIAKTLEDISINKRYFQNLDCISCQEREKKVILGNSNLVKEKRKRIY